MSRKPPAKANWQDAFVKKVVGQDDMTLLSKVKNEDISENLKKRFEIGVIYTYIGHVLIAVNPYRDVGIYRDDILHSYTGKNRIEMPPHVYATAEASYRQLLSYSENQCVIISGESGAGKTESAKKIMEYVAAVSHGHGAGVTKIKDIVLATNPLLEAFGNAKTLRNNNSSRFGKYFEIEFSPSGEPLGGVITNYLLEKGRVCHQIIGERNFHIFYNFTKGASAQFKKDFQLNGPEYYLYTNQSKCLNVDGMNDVNDFQDVLNSMNIIGISQQEQYSIFQLLAAILWIGNLTFNEPKQDNSAIADRSILDMVAYLLEIDASFLEGSIVTRVMETSRGGQRGTTYNVPLNKAQAASVRDALAKSIYDKLFDWIVERINRSMQTKSTSRLLLGVLDIYGFEIFEHNSFEQLCINYVNEKLQQIFIELTLKQEQEEYVKEQIQWTAIEFFNNKIVCDLIEEKKPPGIFSTMDDACATAHADPTQADKSLMQRMGTLSSNPHFTHLGQKGFLIKHYAGDVTYDADGMTDKNKDQLVFDLQEAIQLSKNSFLTSLFPDKVDRSEKKKPTTASSKIKTSCNALVSALSKCTPHYIRCIKPNDNKSPTEYDNKRAMHQIRYLGLLENIRVRRAGFAYRQVFEKFLDRFFLLSRNTSYAGEYIWTGDAKTGCRHICQDCGISKEEWQIGVTKVFIRHPETLWALEHLRERYWHNMAMRIQRAYRNYVRYKHECARRIQRCFRAWNMTKIFLQVRDYGHQVLGGRKERRRFSLLSMRRFMGDYLDFRSNSVLQNACGPGAYNEGVVFTAIIQVLVYRTFKAPKPAPRFLVMTRQFIYIIETRVEKKVAVTELERKIPLRSVQSISMSTLMDDAMVLMIPSEFDIVIFTDFKTEFATHIAWQLGGNVKVEMSNMIEYMKKPNKKAKLTFNKDEMYPKEWIMKKGIVLVGSGMPASSQSFPPCRRNEPPPKPVTTGKLLKKGGPSKAPVSASPAKGAPVKSGAAPTSAPKAAPINPPPKAAPVASSNPKYKALFAYQSQDPSELSFGAGDILEIKEKDENGWWSALLNGKEGFVPSNYLEEIKVTTPSPAAVPKPTPKPTPAQEPAAAPVAAAPKPVASPPMNTGGFVPPTSGAAGLKPAPKPAVTQAPAPVAAAPKPVASTPPNTGGPMAAPRPGPKPGPPPTTQAAPPPTNSTPVAAPKPSMGAPVAAPVAAPKPGMGAPVAAPKPGMGAPVAAPKPGMGAPVAAPKPGMGAPVAAPKPGMGAPVAAPKPGMGAPVAAPKPAAGGAAPFILPKVQRNDDEDNNDDDWD